MTEDKKDDTLIDKIKDKVSAAGRPSPGGTPSEGGSGLGDAETSAGGADAVPDTHG